MGCFLACFGGSSKKKGRRKLVDTSRVYTPSNSVFATAGCDRIIGGQHEPVQLPTVLIKQDVSSIPESGKMPEEQSSASNWIKPEAEQLSVVIPKKVTFDSNVKTIERVSFDDIPQVLSEIQEEQHNTEKNENSSKPNHSISITESGSTLSSSGLYPPNHRYQNCRESDDDADNESSGSEGSDFNENDVVESDYECDDDYGDCNIDTVVGQELSCGSLSSLESNTKSSTRHMINQGADDGQIKTTGLNLKTRDRSGYIHSVLNPVENITQWNCVKAKGIPRLNPQKENFSLFEKARKSKSTLDVANDKEEVRVDASLSTWLVSSQKTPTSEASMIALEPILSERSASSHGSNSLTTQEDRPSLGALTVEELKQCAASNSPRWSPSHSPDNFPVASSVSTCGGASYIKGSGSASSFKGIPNTTSKYREDKRVTWHSTPFETRLERALKKGAAVASSDYHAC